MLYDVIQCDVTAPVGEGGGAPSSVWRKPPASGRLNLSGVWYVGPRVAWDGMGLWCDMRLSDMMRDGGGGGGNTLFSVEKAASFWNTELVWRVVRVA